MPTIDELLGNVYVIGQLSADGAERSLAGEPVMRFVRDEHGVRLSTGACNTVGGYVEIVGDRLVSASVDLGDGLPAGPAWERTDVACDGDRMALDDVLFGFLPGGATIALDGDRLRLTSGATSLAAHRRAPLDLVGPAWHYQGTTAATPVGTVTSFGGLQATLTFTPDGQYVLASTCLGRRGTYASTGAGLTFAPTSPISAGGCQGATGDEGLRVAAVLDQPLTMTVADRILTLTAPDGTVLTFVAG